MLMCTVICKVNFPTGKGMPEARGRAGCQLPAQTHRENSWVEMVLISIAGPVCTVGSCCKVAARGNPAASFGCLRADPARSVTWLLEELSPWEHPLTLFHANLPMHAGCLGRWIIRACFSGRVPFLCSSAPLWLNPWWCKVSSFLRTVHLAVGPGLPCVLHSAFYETGKIQGEERGADTAPFGCLPVQYFRTTSPVLRKNAWMWKGLPSELNYSSEY